MIGAGPAAARVESRLADAKYRPFWLDCPDKPGAEPALEGDARCDLLIVGGGFTGLWAAIQAKEQEPDRSVMLIEADRVASGASGRPGGIISTSVMHGLKNEATFFPDDVAVLERLGQENLDGFKASVERYSIDADLEWNGEMTVAVSPGDLDGLRKEFELHKAHGHDVVLLDRAQTVAQLDSPLFEGAMWSRQRSGIVHPAKLAWGLKAAALSLGVRIHENSPMTAIAEERDGMRVATPRGSIECARVLLATNAWAAGHHTLKRRVMAMRDHVLATEPLSDEQLDRIGWKNRQGVYDTRTQLNYMRLTSDNRIVFGGSVTYHFNGNTAPTDDKPSAAYRGLVHAFGEKFPQLGDVRISHLWGGPIDYCTRYSVFFQRCYSGKAVYVGGYTGFGVGGSRFGARIGVALLSGSDLPELRLDIVRALPTAIPPEPFRWIGAKITFKVLEQVDAKGGWRRLWLDFVGWLGYPL